MLHCSKTRSCIASHKLSGFCSCPVPLHSVRSMTTHSSPNIDDSQLVLCLHFSSKRFCWKIICGHQSSKWVVLQKSISEASSKKTRGVSEYSRIPCGSGQLTAGPSLGIVKRPRAWQSGFPYTEVMVHEKQHKLVADLLQHPIKLLLRPQK